jgi:NAD(P)H dehydrogenase (quinone)
MTTKSKPTLLVTGASGQLGRRVVEILLDGKAGHVIATTRTPDKLAPLAARGAEIRKADFKDPASLRAAFAGAERLLLISTGDLFPLGLRLSQHRAAVAAAVDTGVKHILYTSAPAPYPIAGGGLLDDHFWTEQAIFASPLEWTILRHQIYADTLLMSVPQAATSGQLYSSIGNGASNYVTREDCARVDAAALASDFSGRRILDVTGPKPVTQDEVAALGAELTGRPIRHVTLTLDAQRAGMASAGLPPFLIDALQSFQVQAARGYHAIGAPTIADLTGRAPQSVRDFLTANREKLTPK